MGKLRDEDFRRRFSAQGVGEPEPKMVGVLDRVEEGGTVVGPDPDGVEVDAEDRLVRAPTYDRVTNSVGEGRLVEGYRVSGVVSDYDPLDGLKEKGGGR
jgi:hypothetical protein